MTDPQQTSSPRGDGNRLRHETSPYLLQHAHNPVDWYPWGPEAFAAARERDCPIFLSIGYSACHWCHVMERESFENDQIAAYMNAHYVNIKVDREERPDIDQIYMNAVVAQTGAGGWPMSVFLLPDGQPFYGGTYWPPESRWNRPGFGHVLERVHDAWVNRRSDLQQGAAELTNAAVQLGSPQDDPVGLDVSLLEGARSQLLRAMDRVNGGFGHAPKFPHPMDVRLLLRLSRRFSDEECRQAATLTLEKMARGGMYDQIGGGFHRYSTDARWLVPHFEKMLYDNALLVPAYVEAFQLTGDAFFERVARETLQYVLREMTDPAGGFYATQDADSEGVEGKFFVWSEAEVDDALAEEDRTLFKTAFDVTASGNWEGTNILHRPVDATELLERFGEDAESLEQRLRRCLDQLFEVRKKRIPPGRDEKILTSWNGLMIAAFAQAGAVFGEPELTAAAERCVDFLWNHLFDQHGHLLHAYKDGRARFNGYLDDYACVLDGLIELYQATHDAEVLKRALELAEAMQARFADPAGGFFYTSDDHETLIARNKDCQDNAVPSGNAMAAWSLARLGRLTGRPDLEDAAVRTLESLSGLLQRVPLAAGQSLMALDYLLGPSYELAIVTRDPGDAATFLEALHQRFLPNKLVAVDVGDTDSELVPLLREKPNSGTTSVYICHDQTCRAPVSDRDEFVRVLEDL